METLTPQLVRLELEQSVATVTLARPPVNALNRQVLLELRQVLDVIAQNDEIRAVVLTGAGERSFCTGADLEDFQGLERLNGFRLLKDYGDTFDQIEHLPKPVIAAVNGFAFGGGCELALACDVRVAARNAVFGFPEVGIGLIPSSGGTQRLPRLVPRGKAKSMIFASERISAEEAERIGLVDKLVDVGEACQVAQELARRMCRQAPVALQLAKRAMTEGADLPLQQALTLERELGTQCFGTEDLKEGIAAFFEKRPPNFEGR